jgi:hypothetical protein
LEALVGESTSNASDWHENKVGLCVTFGQGVTQGTKMPFTPSQWTFGTAENVPVSFDNVFADRAFVGFGPFNPMHMLWSRWMVVRKFDDEDLGTVL